MICASDVCLYVAYIGPVENIQWPRNTKIGTEVAHVTRDSDTTFKFKRSKERSTCRGRGHIVAASRTACFIGHNGSCVRPFAVHFLFCSVV